MEKINVRIMDDGLVGDVTNGLVLAEVGDLEHETVNLPQKHHRSRNVDDSTNTPFWQTLVISSLSFSRNFNF